MLALEDAFDVEFPDSLLRRDTFRSVDAIRGALESLGVALPRPEPAPPAPATRARGVGVSARRSAARVPARRRAARRRRRARHLPPVVRVRARGPGASSEYVSAAGAGDGLRRQLHLAPVQARATLERSGYLTLVPEPHRRGLELRGHRGRRPRVPRRPLEAGEDWTDQLSPTDLALCSAAATRLYPLVADESLAAEGSRFEVQTWCFRHEPSPDPARMQSLPPARVRLRRLGRRGGRAPRRAGSTAGRRAARRLGLDGRRRRRERPVLRSRRTAARGEPADQGAQVRARRPDLVGRRPGAIALGQLPRGPLRRGVRPPPCPTGATPTPRASGSGSSASRSRCYLRHGLDSSSWPDRRARLRLGLSRRRARSVIARERCTTRSSEPRLVRPERRARCSGGSPAPQRRARPRRRAARAADRAGGARRVGGTSPHGARPGRARASSPCASTTTGPATRSAISSDPDRDRAWTDSVASAAELLRSCELPTRRRRSGCGSVRRSSARRGHATRPRALARSSCGTPASRAQLPPRARRARGAATRPRRRRLRTASVETAEFVFSAEAAERDPTPRGCSPLEARPLADALLVVVATGSPHLRPAPSTSRGGARRVGDREDQAASLDVDPLHAALPGRDDARDRRLARDAARRRHRLQGPDRTSRDAIVVLGRSRAGRRARRRGSGPTELFGIVTRARRRRATGRSWSSSTSRSRSTPARRGSGSSSRAAGRPRACECVRFDLTGLGDSPLRPTIAELAMYDPSWLADMRRRRRRSLRPDDPSDTVLVGLCSGAYLAVEAGLALALARACASINPPVGIDFLHGTSRLGRRAAHAARALVGAADRGRAAAALGVASSLWRVRGSYCRRCSASTPSSTSRRTARTCSCSRAPTTSRRPRGRHASTGSSASASSHPRGYEVNFVPGLDHSMHAADRPAPAPSRCSTTTSSSASPPRTVSARIPTAHDKEHG